MRRGISSGRQPRNGTRGHCAISSARFPPSNFYQSSSRPDCSPCESDSMVVVRKVARESRRKPVVLPAGRAPRLHTSILLRRVHRHHLEKKELANLPSTECKPGFSHGVVSLIPQRGGIFWDPAVELQQRRSRRCSYFVSRR